MNKGQAKAMFEQLRKLSRPRCSQCGVKRTVMISSEARDGAKKWSVTIYCDCTKTVFRDATRL